MKIIKKLLQTKDKLNWRLRAYHLIQKKAYPNQVPLCVEWVETPNS